MANWWDFQETVKVNGRGILTATKKGTRTWRTRKSTAKEYQQSGQLLITEMVDPGEVFKVIEIPNIICDEGLYLMAGFSIDESVTYDTGITYCEIGTGTTAPAAGNTTLTTYYGRKIITSRSRTNHETTFSTFFTAAQSTANIKEAGMWGGGDAAAGQATGLLFSHFLAAFDNSSGNYDVTISYVLTISRG